MDIFGIMEWGCFILLITGDDIFNAHYAYICPCGFRGEKKKPARLLEILKEHGEKKTLIFVNTKKGAPRECQTLSSASEDTPKESVLTWSPKRIHNKDGMQPPLDV